MEVSQQNRLLIKLFMGLQIDLPLKKELTHSLSWKQSMISWQNQENEKGQEGLFIVPFHKKEYLGQYSIKNSLTLIEIKEVEAAIRQTILMHCPHFNLDSYRLFIFSQLLIT